MVLSLVQLIVLVIIAAIAGAIGQSLAGYRRGGFLLSAVIGFIGALLGVWLAGQLRRQLGARPDAGDGLCAGSDALSISNRHACHLQP